MLIGFDDIKDDIERLTFQVQLDVDMAKDDQLHLNEKTIKALLIRALLKITYYSELLILGDHF